MLDADGYPTEEALEAIASFDLIANPMTEFLALVRDNWWAPDWGFVLKGKRLQLHTGGWSGNEETISYLHKNFLFWSNWRKSTAGGHFYFDLSSWKRKRWK